MRPSGRFLPKMWRATAGANSAALIALSALALVPRARALQSQEAAAPIVIGVVVVTELPVGEETSGSVVADPKDYEDIPGLRVVTAELPSRPTQTTTSQGAALLDGILVDLGDGRKQFANEPLTWIPSTRQSALTLAVLLSDGPTQPLATVTGPLDRPTSSPT